MVQLCIIECTYIGNIIGILLICNLHHYYCILPYTYIQKRLPNQQIKPPNYSQLGIRAFCNQNYFFPLLIDSTPAATLSPHHTGSAAQSANQSKVVADGSFSHQQQPSLVEQHHGSFSHIYVFPLHITGTSTPSIIALSNTQQVVSLNLTNTNYLYWCADKDISLVKVFSILSMAQCCVLPLMFLIVLMVPLWQSTPPFFVGSNRISLF